MTAGTRTRLGIVAAYLIVCVALARLHSSWMEEPPDLLLRSLAAFMGPGLALNTHMSVALFAPLFVATAVPLVAAVQLKRELRWVALLVFTLLWLKTGGFLAPLF